VRAAKLFAYCEATAVATATGDGAPIRIQSRADRLNRLKHAFAMSKFSAEYRPGSIEPLTFCKQTA